MLFQEAKVNEKLCGFLVLVLYFQVSFHAFETVKTAIFVGLGLATSRSYAKIGVEERRDKVPTPIDDGCSFC